MKPDFESDVSEKEKHLRILHVSMRDLIRGTSLCLKLRYGYNACK